MKRLMGFIMLVLATGCAEKATDIRGGANLIRGFSHTIQRTQTDFVVTDYGAKGDGKADDTIALQKAAEALAKATGTAIQPWRRKRAGERKSVGSTPRLLFPRGTYKISGPVIFRGRVWLVAEEGAEIVQTKPDEDAFFIVSGFICRFENFTFRGGRNQVKVNTYNNEGANLRVTGCRFLGANGAGFFSRNYKTDDPNFRRIGPDGRRIRPKPVAEWKWDEETNTPRIDPLFAGPKKSYNNSTMFIVENTLFDDCAKAIDFPIGDGLRVRNCRIASRRNEPGAAVLLGGDVRIWNSEITIRRNQNLSQWAFEGGGRIWLADTKVRTDTGSGVTLWRFTKREERYLAAQLQLVDVETETGPNNVLLDPEDGIPPNIFTCCHVVDHGKGIARSVEETAVSDESISKNRLNSMMKTEEAYLVLWGEDNVNVAPPTGILRRYLKKVSDYTPNRLTFEPGRQPVRAGLTFVHDGRMSLKDFCAQLKANPDSTGILPATTYEVPETIVLDGDYTLEGAGIAVLEGHPEDDGIGFFKTKPGSSVVLKNLQMHGGRHHVEVGAGATVWLDNCYLYDPWGWCLTTEKGGGLVYDGGVVYASFFYSGDGDATFSEQFNHWLPTSWRDEPIRPAATFVNRGRLQVYGFLGVPCVLNRFLKDDIWNPEHKPIEFRWVDNYGDFYALGFRFGGEWGGHVPVYHFGGGAHAA